MEVRSRPVVHGGSSSLGLGLGLALWKQLDVCDIVGVDGRM